MVPALVRTLQVNVFYSRHFLYAIEMFKSLCKTSSLFPEIIQIFERFGGIKHLVKACSVKGASDHANFIIKKIELCGETANTARAINAETIKQRKEVEDSKRAKIREQEEAYKKAREAAGVESFMPARPDEHNCPISFDIMMDPVVANDGITYECSEIAHWLQTNNKSPKTLLSLDAKTLTPNVAMRALIQRWHEDAHKTCMAMQSRLEERDHDDAPPEKKQRT